MTDQTPQPTPVTFDLEGPDSQPGRLAFWLYLATRVTPESAPFDLEVIALKALDPGPVTVEIIPEMDDTRASWIKPLDEATDPNGWLAQLPGDRAALFHLCAKVMDDILTEAVDASPRHFDGEWREPCPAYQQVTGAGFERWYLEVQWDEPGKDPARLAEFYNETMANEALAALVATEVLVVYGHVVRLPEAGGRVAIRHYAVADWTGETCGTCHFTEGEHQAVAS